MNSILSAAFAASTLAVGLAAQTTTYPLNPRASYLRTNSDSPLAPLIIYLTT